MWDLIGRVAVAASLVSAVSFALSWLLLSGEDPEGWWNFVPAAVFYATTFLIVPGLGLVIAVALVIHVIRRAKSR